MTNSKKIEELKIQIEKYNEFYNEKLEELNTKYETSKSAYDGIVSVINCERSLLRTEIRKLYNFLKYFGDIGIEITPFQFEIEKYATRKEFDKKSNLNNDFNKKTRLLGFGLLFGLCGVVGKAIYNANFNRKLYIEKEEEFQKMKLHGEHVILEQEHFLYFLNRATEVATKYYQILILVKNTINDNIIPELDFIKAFLYASVIKDNYLSNSSLINIEPAKITQFKNTKYNKIYNFVKNSFDFYVLISNFFTQPILTKQITNDNFSFNELDQFDEKLIEVQEASLMIESETYLKRDIK